MEWEDWNFAWDNGVTGDCCNKVLSKYKMERGTMKNVYFVKFNCKNG